MLIRKTKTRRRRHKRSGHVPPAVKRADIYRERNRQVRALGFVSYTQYLRSDLWRDIRARVLARSNACALCEGIATQVHHSRYRKKDLEGRGNLRNLFPICRRCHYRIEFRDHDREKLNTKQATAKMRQLRTLRRKRASFRQHMPWPYCLDVEKSPAS